MIERVPRRLALVVCLCTLSGCSSGRTAGVRPGELPEAIQIREIHPAAEVHESEDLEHLRYVLPRETFARYASLGAGDRQELMRLYWASLDPTPTTPENERQEAHYRRLAYVRKHFATGNAPGWDRRGELFLRYGSPQFREIISAEIRVGDRLTPPQEIWVYLFPHTTFHLADELLSGNFQDWSGRIASTRVDLAHGSGSITRGSSLAREVRRPTLVSFDGERSLGAGFHALRRGTHRHFHDHGGNRLDYVFEILNSASDEPDRTRVEINVAVGPGRLVDRSTGETAATELEIEAVAKTMDYREVERATHTSEVGPARTAARGTIVDQVTLDLPPGPHRIALRVRDLASGDVGIYTTDTSVRDLGRGTLEISDLRLAFPAPAGWAGPAECEQHFATDAGLLLPNPSRIVPAGSTPSLAFAIYRLQIPPAGPGIYTVEMKVWSGATRSESAIGTEYVGRSPTAMAQEVVSLDTAGMSPGMYELEIGVLDHGSGERTRGAIHLFIQEKPGRDGGAIADAPR